MAHGANVCCAPGVGVSRCQSEAQTHRCRDQWAEMCSECVTSGPARLPAAGPLPLLPLCPCVLTFRTGGVLSQGWAVPLGRVAAPPQTAAHWACCQTVGLGSRGALDLEGRLDAETLCPARDGGWGCWTAPSRSGCVPSSYEPVCRHFVFPDSRFALLTWSSPSLEEYAHINALARCSSLMVEE